MLAKESRLNPASAAETLMGIDADKTYPIRTVAKLSGLTPDLIRAWEKRYAVVAPQRGPRGARLYSDDDIQRLTLLARAVGQGRSIGDVAHLDSPALGNLLMATRPVPREARMTATTELGPYLSAIDDLDIVTLERLLGESLLAHGSATFAQELATPLLAEVGRRWADGRLSIAQEHLVTTAMRNLLGTLSHTSRDPAAPTLLLAAPSGERHEIGLLVVAVLAGERGVRVILLGGDVPAADIAETARRLKVAGVGLSVTAADNRIEAARAVASLERDLPPSVHVWLGGNDAHHVASLLPSRRAIVVQGVDEIQRHFDVLHQARIRYGSGPANTTSQ